MPRDPSLATVPRDGGQKWPCVLVPSGSGDTPPVPAPMVGHLWGTASIHLLRWPLHEQGGMDPPVPNSLPIASPLGLARVANPWPCPAVTALLSPTRHQPVVEHR